MTYCEQRAAGQFTLSRSSSHDMPRMHGALSYALGLLLGLLLPFQTLAHENPKLAATARFVQEGTFDPRILSEDELLTELRAVYGRESNREKKKSQAHSLLSLKWRRLWESNWEMAAEHVLLCDPLDEIFQTDERWQWSPPLENPFDTGRRAQRLHYSRAENGVARHRVQGVFPMLLPVNGSLEQDVYFPNGQVPNQISIRVETIYVGRRHETSSFVQAYWTTQEMQVFNTENRPESFWAGTLKPDPEHPAWQRLHVDLLDLGLCGRDRSILGVEFSVSGGEAWFGPTLLRRPPVEVRGVRPYNLFFDNEPLKFNVETHNFSSQTQEYRLDVRVSNYQGSGLVHSTYSLVLPPHKSTLTQFTVPPGPSRYYVLEYRLRQQGQVIYEGHSSAAVIVPNSTGRKAQTKFGMMYWDPPGQDMLRLYQQLGVKHIVTFPRKEELYLFDPHSFDVMPMIWALPEGNAKEEEQLRKQVEPYLKAGQRIFSNFWETDLRVPADMFAPHMQRFYEILKQLEPAATVGIGGMAWCNVAYLAQLIDVAKKIGHFFDFVAVMSYITPSPPEYSGLDQESDALLGLLESQKDKVTELWNVEWSYFDSLNLDRGVWQNTSLRRENWIPYYIRHHLFGFSSGMDRMIPGSPFYAGRMPLSKNYGHSMILGRNSLFRYDLSPLPLLPAYSTMTRMLEGKSFVRSLSTHPDIFCHLYTAYDDSYKPLKSARNILAFWTPFEGKNIRLKVPQTLSDLHKTPFHVLNMLGEISSLQSCHGELELHLSPEPQYLLLPDAAPEELDALDIVYDDPMLTLSPKSIELGPGHSQTAVLTCQIFNPGSHALRGQLRIALPDGMKLLSSKIRYADEIGRLLAEKMLTQTRRDAEAPALYLGRNRSAELRIEIQYPGRIRRKSYYEEYEITQQPSARLLVELYSDQDRIAWSESAVHQLPPLSLRMRPVLSQKDDVQHPRLKIQLTNHSSEARQGRMELLSHAMLLPTPSVFQFALDPGETQEFDCSIQGEPALGRDYIRETVDTHLQRRNQQVTLGEKQPFPLDHHQKAFGYLISHGIGEGYVIEALVHDQFGNEQRIGRGWAFRPAVRANNALVIDGRFDEWDKASPLFVHPEGRLGGLTFFAEMYGRKMQWEGLDDFSSAWQMMWDEHYLYLAVKVFDDRIVPQHMLGKTFWNGDSISLQIDPVPEVTDLSLLPRPRDLRTIHTFDIGLSRSGPQIRRKHAAAGHDSGPVSGAKLAIQTRSDAVAYEVAIPWEELSPLRPYAGAWMGCSLVFYEDDGHGRETKSQWFGGSNGNGLAREPRLMGDVHFVQ
ncbi:hypothetical protein CSB45_08505 [candidate division KSB3 bacterium]|uniref:Uncharacterized protein n=1 Tax=candidate division KSB3 bacterium TaxID=2044937 RepID=A0A2G6E5N9_9BACT|nr:MAG: hypothetical protein CSB45_08505 [candidate division KSB3 bacterium]PIE29741.1 MAG: hypothetical protein CSA57_06710 [candidate division KSB3 bacterium]